MMRPSIRFQVFKRDGFTCAYCGRKPPDVTLEVDHIIPSSQGGGDEHENLVTSCWDCNRDKGSTPLDAEPATIPSLTERAALLREREHQVARLEGRITACTVCGGELVLEPGDDKTASWHHLACGAE